jgi:LacI family transcriptional regulator
MAGIKDIAKLTGLSLATVSRVFNESSLVSKKTRNKVLKAAQELDYQPNMIASALRSGKSKIIGVIVPEINNYFFSNVINGIEKELTNNGFKIIISQSHESSSIEKDSLLSFINLNVDGVLISTSIQTSDLSIFSKLIKHNIPIVYFDRSPDIHQINSVVLNDFEGAFIATQHLIDSGCKQIVHVLGDTNTIIFKKRKEGFIEALKINNYTVQEDSILELNDSLAANTRTIQELLIKNPGIDGIFSHGDEKCLHVMNILKSLNIIVPDQIKLIGFGNNEYASFVNPSLSSIDQKCNDMGILSARMLVSKIVAPDNIFSQQVLSPELVIRNSSSA